MAETIKMIEAEMATVMLDWVHYQKVIAEFHRLLEIMGNVDGNEIAVLVLTAAARLDALDGIGPKPD